MLANLLSILFPSRQLNTKTNEQSISLRAAWELFIETNIHQAHTQYQCLGIKKLIDLFIIRFRPEYPTLCFMDSVHRMMTMLDQKYRNLQLEENALGQMKYNSTTKTFEL